MVARTSASDESKLLLTQLSIEFLQERRRRQRRSWFKRVLFLIVLIWLVYLFFYVKRDHLVETIQQHVGLIDIKGGIFEGERANADNFAESMDDAYSHKSLKSIILRIDSPGGSPVQADYIYNLIRYYREKKPDIKIYAVCMDTCASAAYYIAAAADEIYANPSSIVGSIGVLYNGFGFVDTLQKLGVTRRLKTAGHNKGFMDPFSPTNPQEEQTLQVMLDIIHQQFIDKVKAGRGSRLVVDADTFSGLFWTGVQAKQRGLIDGFASPGELARDIIQIDHMVDYSIKENKIEKFMKKFGAALVSEISEHLKIGLKPSLGFQ